MIRIRGSRLLLALALLGPIAFPARTSAQCVTSITNMTTIGSFIRITKMIAPSAICTTVAPMSAFGCGEVPGMTSATMLVASALTAIYTNPQCNWVCNCPGSPMQPISITAADGLPVELMDFSIEDEEGEGDAGSQEGERSG